MRLPRTSTLLLLLASLALCYGGEATGQLTPIGPSSWMRPDGRITHVMGPGSALAPEFNYWDGEKWAFVVDDWEQIGGKQIWRAVHGKHRVWSDSTGAAIYARGNHYLGIEPTALIKFNKTDSTWQTLKAKAPDSIRVEANAITFFGVYPGVHMVRHNNVKVFEEFGDKYYFTQEARDSLANWGPWSNRLLGTVSRLNIDSLNLTMRDLDGVFTPTAAGRLVSGIVDFDDGATPIFRMRESFLEMGDSVTSIPVHKFIVVKGGNPYLVEMFDPILANQLPPGDIHHNVIIGKPVAGSNFTTIKDIMKGMVLQYGGQLTPPCDIDSLTANLTNNSATTSHSARLAIHEWDLAGDTAKALIDTSAHITLSTSFDGWKSEPARMGGQFTEGSLYLMSAWGTGTGSGPFTQGANIRYNTTILDAKYAATTRTYAGNTWPDPYGTPGSVSTTLLALYAFVTETWERVGADSASSLSGNVADKIWGSLFQPSSDGTAKAVRGYCVGLSDGDTLTYAVYNAAGNVLKDSTAWYISGDNEGFTHWIWLSLTNEFSVDADSTYLICAWAGGTAINFKFGNTLNSSKYDNQTFGGWPATLSLTDEAGPISIVMLYDTTTAVAGDTGRRRLMLLGIEE